MDKLLYFLRIRYWLFNKINDVITIYIWMKLLILNLHEFSQPSDE